MRLLFAVVQMALSLAFLANKTIEDHRLWQAGWDPCYMWRTPSTSEKLFDIVGFPALAAASMVEPGCETRERWLALGIGESLILSLAVGALWFAMGRGLDRMLGWLPGPRRRGNKASLLAAALGVVLLVVMIARMSFVQLISRWPVFDHWFVAICFWSAVACYTLCLHIIRFWYQEAQPVVAS